MKRAVFFLMIVGLMPMYTFGNYTVRQLANGVSEKPSSEYVEDVQVSGFVTNAKDGKQIAGVVVRIKGGNAGTVSDVNGKYLLKVSSDAILLFSFAGMATQEIAVNSQQVINVVMDTDVQSETEMLTQQQNVLKTVDTPLIVVDGKEGGDLNSISPENIESITVLRDQSAIEQYGDKAKNGVVIIVTKK